MTTHGETQSECWPLCSNARRWGVRPRRGWLTSPIWGTYVYLLSTTYRVGLHDVPLEGLVQVRHCIRGTDAVPPPPRPTAQEQRYDAGLINTNPRTITGHVKQIANNQTNINRNISLNKPLLHPQPPKPVEKIELFLNIYDLTT